MRARGIGGAFGLTAPNVVAPVTFLAMMLRLGVARLRARPAGAA